MAHEIFPTVGAVTVEFNGDWLIIEQESTSGDDNDTIAIPNRLVDIFLEEINRAMGGEG